jgi:hypothetical protein
LAKRVDPQKDADLNIRGVKMGARGDLDADMSKTARDGDRLEQWINR